MSHRRRVLITKGGVAGRRARRAACLVGLFAIAAAPAAAPGKCSEPEARPSHAAPRAPMLRSAVARRLAHRSGRHLGHRRGRHLGHRHGRHRGHGWHRGHELGPLADRPVSPPPPPVTAPPSAAKARPRHPLPVSSPRPSPLPPSAGSAPPPGLPPRLSRSARATRRGSGTRSGRQSRPPARRRALARLRALQPPAIPPASLVRSATTVAPPVAGARVSGPSLGVLIALIATLGALAVVALRLRPHWFARRKRSTAS